MKQRIKDGFWQGIIYACAAITCSIVIVIFGFLFKNGIAKWNLSFLLHMWEDQTTFVTVIPQKTLQKSQQSGYVPTLGVTLRKEQDGTFVITKVDSNAPVKQAKDLSDHKYPLKKGDIIGKIGTMSFNGQDHLSLEHMIKESQKQSSRIQMKVVRPGGGIFPMLVSTLYLILLSLLFAAPVGIFSAVYLNEYAKKGKLLQVIRFAIQNLAGIPSIIYGLFGMLVFVQLCNMKYSILAGALTMSIILLPVIISTTEEALKTIPKGYRESSLGLGATKLQTICKVVLPNAIPGILVAIILSIGRVVGESAALIWTAGTVAQIPTSLTGDTASAATLTTKLYWIMKETGDLKSASAIGLVLVCFVVLLNFISKQVSNYFLKKQGKA